MPAKNGDKGGASPARETIAAAIGRIFFSVVAVCALALIIGGTAVALAWMRGVFTTLWGG